MPRLHVLAALALLGCTGALAQAPPPAPNGPLVLTFQEALARARANSTQALTAALDAQIASETAVQAKAALLPNANWNNGYIYTQPNGTDTGVFVANNGPHEYINQATVHSDVWAPGRIADYHASLAAAAAARARADIALRGLTAVVVQNYYGMVVAARKIDDARHSLSEAQEFVDITRKLEAGGEVAHADVVKAEILLLQRQRDLQDAQLALEKARIGLAVLLFPDFRQDFDVIDDLGTRPPLPGFAQAENLAQRNNPDMRLAHATITQQTYAVKSARALYYPTFSLDYFFGMDALNYGADNRYGQNNLGSALVAGVNIPVWNWGLTRSRVRQAEFQLQQARVALSATQRQLLANLNAFYQEARTANEQMDSLRHSLDLAEESLHLTLLSYQAGEVDILSLVDAQTTLALARIAYDDGLYRYRVALGDLQTVTGVF